MVSGHGRSPLVSAAELASRLGDPGWIVVDCRFNLMEPDAGRKAYEKSHIPGARYADLDRDLARPVRGAAGGRHPLPEPAEFQRLLDGWGLTRDSRVVCYDDVGGAVAARLWWLLRWFGLPGSAVLDGGWGRWLAGSHPVDAATPVARQGSFRGEPGQRPVIGVDSVARGLREDALLLLDARVAARFAGEQEPIDTRAGHVPGAVNAPFEINLTETGEFLDAKALRQIYLGFAGNRATDEIACMCGSGVTACHTLLALELAGLDGASLYVGSWSDWISGDRAIAVGRD